MVKYSAIVNIQSGDAPEVQVQVGEFSVLNTNFIRIFFARTFFSVSHSLLLVGLPLIMAAMGWSAGEIGAVMGAFGVGVLLGRPLVTYLLHHRNRMLVIWIGAVIFVIGPLLFYFFPDTTLYRAYRLIQGLAFSIVFTASLTMVIDQTPHRKRGETLSYLGLSQDTVLVIGPIMAVAMLERFGAGTVFIGACAASVVSLILLYFVKEMVLPENQATETGTARPRLPMEIPLATLLLFLNAVVHGAVFFFLPLYIQQTFNHNGGLFFTCFGLASLSIRGFSGRYSDRLGRRPVALTGILFLTAGIFLISRADTLGWLVLAACVYGFGFGSYMPAMTAFVSDRTTAANRVGILGLYFAAFDAGVAMSGWLMGWLADRYGIQIMFQYAAWFLLAAFIVFVVFLAPHTRKGPPLAPSPQIPEEA